jgi:hypothetical protein
MRKILFIVSLIFVFGSSANAGDYALGGRISNQFGITGKYNYRSNTWIEGIVDIGSHEISLSGLFEQYYETPFSRNLNWFVGGGPYLGFWGNGNSSNAWLGVKGVLGVCYNFNDIPVDLSFDWMPEFQLVSKFTPTFNVFGLSVRYTF